MNDTLKLDARELASKLTASLAYTRDPNYKQVVHKNLVVGKLPQRIVDFKVQNKSSK